jgi:hypothetical protein
MRLPRVWNSIKGIFARVIPWVVFTCLAVAMLFDPTRNTLGVASSAFAVALALAAVTFSYARTLKDGSAVRDELVFAGERLVAGAVMFLVASILKYAANDIPRYADALFQAVPRPDGQAAPDLTLFGQNIFGLFLSLFAFLNFLFGLILAQMGMMILSNVAAHRAKRRSCHDDFFFGTKSLEQRTAELDEMDRGGGSLVGTLPESPLSAPKADC